MDILKTATDWAKAEVFSTSFFLVFGLLFLAASAGFWQLGKSDLARAYVIPLTVAGVLLLVIGSGLVYTNKTRVVAFEQAYDTDAKAFVGEEISRAEGTLQEYKTVVFTAIPVIIAVCALGLIFFSSPIWRASLISAMAMLIVILLIDGTAHARIAAYHQQLLSVSETL
ncbi:MAG: hypothetical protein AAFN92_14985 [Bacteroidota bacterium]